VLAGLTALALAACGSDNNTSGGQTSSSAAATTAAETTPAGQTTPAVTVSGDLEGGGASSQEKAQGAWRAGFQGANPSATVNYTTSDSGAGRKGFLEGSLDFAGSDGALSTDELASSVERCFGGSGIDLPVYVSPIAVAFNLEGVTSLNLTPDTIAKIFAGTITSWDDPAITADNSGVTLSGAITVVHRSDDSGTSKNFEDYLAKTAPDVWTYDVTNTWPVDVGQGASGTSGVVQAITAATGTIGYADASAVGTLGKVSVGVGDAFVAPTADAAAATVDASKQDDTRAANDISISIDRTTTAAGAYPAILVSYLIVCDTYDSQDKVDLVKAYASYVASAEGQEASASAAGNAPISTDLTAKVQSAIDSIKVKG
jgi:phosphate transport system substrate-binding protein